MGHEDYAEWLADFGARALDSADLERLLTRARDLSDDDLRRLVKQHQTLRRLVRDFLLPRLEASTVPLTEPERTLIAFVRDAVRDGSEGSAA
jgi:hypothetical protein